MRNHKYRSHNCSELNVNNINQKVKLSGWISSKRDHGSLIFIDLRDYYGTTQLVISRDNNHLNIDRISSLKLESVILVEGEVVMREKNSTNPTISTGDIEVYVGSLQIETESEQIPFPISEKHNHYPEEIRLKYRFLDIRRDRIKKNIVLRSKIISFIRSELENIGFLDIQTPILTSFSPEGAKHYLVPSRVHKGKFYALPQAPQQFKQILMVGGIDKYFQIAPCFRDEDLRADRSPEFYQLDMEMAFVTQEDIFKILEFLLKKIFNQFGSKKIDSDFKIITYQESILKYGTDKPDLRNPLLISDTTEIFKESNFSIFAKSIKKGSLVKAIAVKNLHNKPRSFFDKMIEFAINNGAKGLAYITFDEDNNPKGPISKLLTKEEILELQNITQTAKNDSIFFSCDSEKEVNKISSLIRTELGNLLNLIDYNIYKFCWIVDFPMYEFNSDSKQIEFAHNPFSMPQGGMESLENSNPLEIKAYQYDIVCNGIELSSGAIRNHKLDIMYKAFEIAGYTKEKVNTNFSAMINAFKYGVPPHGGIAPGIDRIIMLLLDEPNIREVIPFPMNGKSQDLMMGTPMKADKKQLKDLSIILDLKKEK